MIKKIQIKRKTILIALLIAVILLSGISLVEGSTGSKPNDTYDLPIVGEVRGDAYPLVVLTVLIAFVDGLNPCSIWVLSFLLGIVLYSGKKDVIMVGLTFLIVTALVYGLFIAGALTIFHFIAHLFWIRMIVAVIAIIFASVSIKDFFWFKKGISFTIPDRYKPGIYKKVRGLMKKEDSLTLIGATAVMAAGIALVELPCTAGFPVIWSQIVAERALETPVYIAFLILYVLIYLSIEMIIYFGAAVQMKRFDFGKKEGRIMKLVGGSIMLILGLIMLIDYTMMEDLRWTLILFALTISVTLITAKIYMILGKFDED